MRPHQHGDVAGPEASPTAPLPRREAEQLADLRTVTSTAIVAAWGFLPRSDPGSRNQCNRPAVLLCGKRTRLFSLCRNSPSPSGTNTDSRRRRRPLPHVGEELRYRSDERGRRTVVHLQRGSQFCRDRSGRVEVGEDIAAVEREDRLLSDRPRTRPDCRSPRRSSGRSHTAGDSCPGTRRSGRPCRLPAAPTPAGRSPPRPGPSRPPAACPHRRSPPPPVSAAAFQSSRSRSARASARRRIPLSPSFSEGLFGIPGRTSVNGLFRIFASASRASTSMRRPGTFHSPLPTPSTSGE